MAADPNQRPPEPPPEPPPLPPPPPPPPPPAVDVIVIVAKVPAGPVYIQFPVIILPGPRTFGVLSNPQGAFNTMMSKAFLDAPQKGQKGKALRGGKKSARDKWYGKNDPEFQRWWHREGKKEFGGNDIENANEAQEAWDHWDGLGRPTVK